MVLSGEVQAEGSIALSWNRPVSASHPPILARAYEGPGFYDLYVTLTGQSTPVAAFLIELRLGVGRPFCPPLGDLPSAWHFEGGGCHAGGACFVGGGLLDPSSPLQSRIQRVTGLWQDSDGRGRLVFVEYYAEDGTPFPLVPLDPSRTYTLGRFRFEHSGTCAGEEDSIYIDVRQAHWVTYPNDVEYVWEGDNEAFVLWNGVSTSRVACGAAQLAVGTDLRDVVNGDSFIDPFFRACDLPVSAAATTWGRMKAAYR
jgi:hypothetical protein